MKNLIISLLTILTLGCVAQEPDAYSIPVCNEIKQNAIDSVNFTRDVQENLLLAKIRNVDIIADTVMESYNSLLDQSDFAPYDVIDYNPAGDPEWLYSSWEDSVVVDTTFYFQYRINGTGTMERRHVKIWRTEVQKIKHSFDSMLKEKNVDGKYKNKVKDKDKDK